MIPRMFELMGGQTVVVQIDRNVSYTQIENALNGEAFLSDYRIDRTEVPGGVEVAISVNVPLSAITGDGVPHLQAVQTLRALANALETIEQQG